MDEPLGEINIAVHEILRKISLCKEGFLLNTYLDNSKKVSIAIEKVQSSYAGSKAISNAANSGIHVNLYNRLSELRKRLARENRIAVSRVYRDTVIDKICENLPCDTESLLNIKGITAKIKSYADEIINIVNAYCKENNIEPKKVIKGDPSSQGVTETVEETLKIFKSGKTIAEVAKERNFVESTIESHLAKGILSGSVNIEEVMPMAEVKTIAGYFTSTDGALQLAGIKERVPAEVSWGKLRMVLAWLQKEK